MSEAEWSQAEETLSPLGLKWALPILRELAVQERRPTELRERLVAPERVLLTTLERLSRDGLIERQPQAGERAVIYRLTDHGRAAVDATHDLTARAGLPVDRGKASPARMYDYYLGGKDNYAIDREAAAQVIGLNPAQPQLARANRQFLVAAVQLMANNGIRQFIDLGTGIPTSPNVHEVARQSHPAARVVYVDNDPIVIVHARALLDEDSGIAVIDADVRSPDRLLQSPIVRQLIDFTEPVGVLVVGVLHFVEDLYAENLVRRFREAVPNGSHLAISTGSNDGVPDEDIHRVQDAYARSTVPVVPRSRTQILDLFGNFELVDPGLVSVFEWRTTPVEPPQQWKILSGVAIKNRPDHPLPR